MTAMFPSFDSNTRRQMVHKTKANRCDNEDDVKESAQLHINFLVGLTPGKTKDSR